MSVLAQADVDLIRAIVRDELAGGTDTLTPDGGQTLNPDGTITYDFAGHVHAKGLDLDVHDTGPGISPNDDDSIRWLDALVDPDGVATRIGTSHRTGTNAHDVASYEVDARPGQNAELQLMARSDTLGQAALNLIAAAAAGAGTIIASAGSSSKIITNGDEVSSFLQLLAAQRILIGLLPTFAFPAINVGTNNTQAVAHGFPAGAAAFYAFGELGGAFAELAGRSVAVGAANVAVTVGNPSAVNFPAGITYRGALIAAY